MLLLGKLGWDVSGVTAFDFVDHLMERIDLSSSSSQVSSGHNVPLTTGSVRDSAAVLRGHALTYVSLCCTGKKIKSLIFFFFSGKSLAERINSVSTEQMIFSRPAAVSSPLFFSTIIVIMK